MEDEFLEWYKENETRFHQGHLDEKEIAYSAWLEGQKAGQHETIVNFLISRKHHWMSESRRLAIEEPDSDEAEDATHMYAVYIYAVGDMKTFLKEGH